MSARFFVLSFILILQTGCAELRTGRSYLSEMEQNDSSFYNPQEDFPVVAGDSGRNWLSESERRSRTPASEDEILEDRASRALKAELRQLENMQSSENYELYEAHKEKLSSTSQRIYFLKLSPEDRKDYLRSRGLIPETAQVITPYDRMGSRRSNDVMLGMQKAEVMASLGRPMRVEVAGNPRNENERWLYRVNGNPKFIYFESGRVEGWE